jgi:holliday junction DNA helicase RuvA
VIRSVRGTLRGAGPDGALVEVGGVGLLLHVSAQTLSDLPAPGEVVRLDTHLAVREDALDLYGFSRPGERELFEAFIAVSGVGPRLALSLCGLDRPDGLRHAIAVGDAKRLQAASGVGRRTAERLVLELRDRVRALSGVGAPRPAQGPAGEAHEAMIALGYTPEETAYALADAPVDADAAALVRHALGRLRRR